MKLLHGDCLEELKKLDADSIDAIVTDPPYGLSFMGKKWDHSVPSVEVWREALRVLKPGGHMLVACGTRTQHRMVVNIEDAGFEIRDVITWLYGQGFPKSLDISKAIDKAAGAMAHRGKAFRTAGAGDREDIQTANGIAGVEKHAGITDDAKKWQGFGTALKPACEFWTLARKPLSEKNVAANVLKWGTGGLNIDGSRISTDEKLSQGASNLGFSGVKEAIKTQQNPQGRFPANLVLDEEAGAALDEQSGSLTSGANPTRRCSAKFKNAFGKFDGQAECVPSRGADHGGASRFFYCAKVSSSERNAGVVGHLSWESADLQSELTDVNLRAKAIFDIGLPSIAERLWSIVWSGNGPMGQSRMDFRFTIETVSKLITESKTSNLSTPSITRESTLDAIRTIEASGLSLAESAAYLSQLEPTTTFREQAAAVQSVSHALLLALSRVRDRARQGNVHSTVKPIKLMRYLCKLVTPLNGVVLDPFMGSGSTGLAAIQEGFQFVGIEREAEYIEIAAKRLAHAQKA